MRRRSRRGLAMSWPLQIGLPMFLHWLAKHGQAYLDRKERDFGMEVQRKRVKFGLPVS